MTAEDENQPQSTVEIRPTQTNEEARLKALIPLTENLAKSVTCPVCLEYMLSPKQLQCGHLFCSDCTTRILSMTDQRCAVCKEKTGKRMIRSAPLPFDQIIQSLRVLENVVDDFKKKHHHVETTHSKDLQHQQQHADVARAMKRIQDIQKQQLTKAKNVLATSSATTTPKSSDAEMKFGRYCHFCPKGVSTDFFTDRVKFGTMLRVPGPKGSKPILVHEFCAMYSEGVYQVDDGELENVGRCYEKTRGIVCSRDACGRDHANIPCSNKACGKAYHFPCAILEEGLAIEDGYKYYCPSHKGEAPVIDDNEFQQKLADPEDDVSLRHELACYVCNSGGRLLMCDTCNHVAHPACVGLKGIPIGDWSCGICTGEHKERVTKKGTKRKQSNSQETPVTTTAKRRRSDRKSSDKSSNPIEDQTEAEPTKRSRRSSDGGKRYVLLHSGLRTSQREILTSIAKTRKTTLKGDIDNRVTHMIISADTPEDFPRRTMKLCKAIAARIPLVCWKWVDESVENDFQWVAMDKHIHPLSWTDEKTIFEGRRFYFGCYSGPKAMREDLISLVQLGGGNIVHHEPTAGNDATQSALLYVFNDENGKSRRESTTRSQVPSDATAVTSNWILDQCTKNRT